MISKKSIAIILAIVLCITAMPAFVQADESTIRPVKVLNLSSTPVKIAGDGLGADSGNFGIVISNNSLTELGIDKSEFTASTTIQTAGTKYEGLTISGEIVMYSWWYRPSSTNTTHASQRVIFEGDGAAYVKYENVKVTSIRTTSGDNFKLVFQTNEDTFFDCVTSIKKYNGKTKEELQALTDDTELEESLEEIPPEQWDKTLYLSHLGGLKPGEMYAFSGKTVDIAPFTASTQFLSLQSDDMYGTTVSGLGWSTTTTGGFSHWANSSGTDNESKPGPYTVVTPKFSGEYTVWMLRKTHGSSPKTVRVAIDDKIMSTGDYNSNVSGWGVAWKSTDATVTLEKGKAIHIEDMTMKSGTSGALIALAFVPKDETITLPDGASNGFMQVSAIDSSTLTAFSEEAFIKDTLANYNVTVKLYANDAETNAEAVDTNNTVPAIPYFARSEKNGESVTAEMFGGNVLGEPTLQYASAADAVTKYYALTVATDDSWDRINTAIYVNGIRVYGPDNYLVEEDDVIEIRPITMTVANFNPISMNGKSVAVLAGGTQCRYGVAISSLPTCVYSDGIANGIQFAGYLTAKGHSTQASMTPYIGEKVYFDNFSSFSKIDYNQTPPIVNVYFYFNDVGANAGTTPVITANGRSVHDPYKVFAGQNAFYAYEHKNLFVVNSAATDKILTSDFNGLKVLRTNGGFAQVKITIVTETNGNQTIESKDVLLLPTTYYGLTLKQGQKAYIWGNTPYEGTTMKPLCGIIQ